MSGLHTLKKATGGFLKVLKSVCAMFGTSNSDPKKKPEPVSGNPPQINHDAQMTATVEALAQAVAADAIHPKAQVLMPPEEQLTVQLVKLEDVLHLQETASDENLIAGAFMAIVGAFLGIFINLVTSDVTSISKATWVAIVANILFLIALGSFWRRLHNRYNEELKRLIQGSTND
jgi:hypothetical protein